MESIVPENGGFLIRSARDQYRASRVLLAIGRRGSPRRLDVPGEQHPKVAYKLMEPEQYRKKKLLVVGGGDSAVEAAVRLAGEEGTEVSLSYRKHVFSRIKEKNREGIEAAMRTGRVTAYMESEVESIEPRGAHLIQQGRRLSLDNDYVFVFIGGELPIAFLQSIGVRMEKKFGER